MAKRSKRSHLVTRLMSVGSYSNWVIYSSLIPGKR